MERGIPGEAAFRRAVARRCALGGAAICLVFLGVNAARGTWAGVAIDAVAAILLLALWRLGRSSAAPSLVGWALAAVLVLVVVPLAFRSAVQAWFWTLAVPLVVFFAAGPRSGLVLSLLLGLVMAALLAMVPPTRVLPFLPASILGSYALVVLLAWSYEQARAQWKEQLERLAGQDPLTGCANRRALEDFLEQEIRRCRRYGLPLSVIAIDLDRFKAINDALGHAAGDRALCEVARVLRSEVREIDLVARIGGDEFLVVCPMTEPGTLRSAQGAAALAERIRRAVHRAQPLPGVPLRLTLGVAGLAPGDDASALVHRADTALVATRRLGRDRVGVASPPGPLGASAASPPS